MQNTAHTGTLLESYGASLGDYLWSTNLTSQQFEKLLVYKNRNMSGRFFMQDFLAVLGDKRRVPTDSTTYGWAEMPKQKYGATIDTVVGAFGSATITVDTTNTEIRLQQYDRLNLSSGKQAWVTATPTVVGGKERLVLSKVDGTNWASGELAAGQILGDAGNAWPENSAQPDGEQQYPTPYFNRTTIIKETNKYSGTVLAAATGIVTIDSGDGTGPWVPVEEYEALNRFQKAREDNYMWSEESIPASGGSTISSTRGIVPDVLANASASVNYAGPVDELDLRGLMTQFDDLTDEEEFAALCGGTYWKEINAGLAQYLVQGNYSYGVFNPAQFAHVGIKLNAYSFADKTLMFKRYRGFDDAYTTGTPASGGPTATQIDFKQFALFLNLGENAGTDQTGKAGQLPYLSYRYRALGDTNRSVVVGFLKGMTGRWNALSDQMIQGSSDIQALLDFERSHVASPIDADQMFLLSEVGAQLLCVDTAHGFMKATS
ncbi:hypothetical protein [uncultured Sphaerochaeta sp.]|uniref:hypothetical protein n=1 Tax=uncultured Sphaerochaeta sp. TaxID=886478 RepID=UPI00262C5458|nr:hypothetical protein [uncultured Sphaerochaeta sp.]